MIISIIICFLSITNLTAQYQFYGSDGHALTQVQPGVPFYIVAELPVRTDAQQLIKLGHQIQGARLGEPKTQQSMVHNNGVTTYKTAVTWQAVADELGTVICPAYAGDGSAIELKKLPVTLDAPQAVQKLQVTMGLTQAYEKQAVPFTVTLDHELTAQEVTLHLPVTIEKNCTLMPEKTTQVKMAAGARTTWQGFYYPQLTHHKNQELVIPAFSASYTIPQKHYYFSFFAQQQHATQTIFSAARTMYIKKLPASAQKIQAVGAFDKLDICAPQEVSLGKAGELALILYGEEGALRTAQIALENSEQLNFYAGQTQYFPTHARFQYVINPQKPQENIPFTYIFTYFDPYQEQIKTLEAPCHYFTITGDLKEAPTYTLPDQPLQVSSPASEIVYASPLYHARLPWNIVLLNIVLAVLCALISVVWIYTPVRGSLQTLYGWLYAQWLASKIRWTSGDHRMLYHTMRAFLCKRMGVSVSITDAQLICLIAEHESSTRTQQWEQILLQLQQLSYADLEYHKKISATLVHQMSALLRTTPLLIKKYLILFSLIGLSAYATTPADEIAALRVQQCSCSALNYYRIEQRIAQLYAQADVHYVFMAGNTVMRLAMRIVPILFMQIVFILLLWLTLVAVMLQARARVMSACLLALLLSGSILMGSYLEQTRCRGIVRQDVELYAGPDMRYHRIGHAPQLSEGELIGELNGWYAFSYNGVQGWIPQEHIVMIESL